MEIQVNWWNIDYGQEEIQAIIGAINNRNISQGKITAEYERRFSDILGVPFAVATTSGSVALLLALMAMDIRPGDEVIVPNRTFIATAHAALILGAKVVLADVRPDIPILDTSVLRRLITSKTRAIMPVHLCGRAVNMDEVNHFASENGLAVVEDACQAFYSRDSKGRFLGTLSDTGCFSLGMAKLVPTGQGGVVVTHKKEVFEKIMLCKNHGVGDTFYTSYDRFGFNFKFTDLQASIGLIQLERLKDKVEHVNRIYNAYCEGLDGLDFIRMLPVNVGKGEVPLYAEALCPERDALMAYLDHNGIQVRPMLPNLHVSAHLKNTGTFPNSEVFHTQGLCLPCGPSQPLKHVDFVIRKIHDFARRDNFAEVF